MKGDLISRSALLNRLAVYGNSKYKTDYNDGWDDARNEITLVVKHAEAVDAEPVRHGYWMPKDDRRIKYMCSICRVTGCGGYEKFCPNCGAKMDAEEV